MSERSEQRAGTDFEAGNGATGFKPSSRRPTNFNRRSNDLSARWNTQSVIGSYRRAEYRERFGIVIFAETTNIGSTRTTPCSNRLKRYASDVENCFDDEMKRHLSVLH